MKIESVTDRSLSGVKVINFSRFADERGYFTEHYRESDINKIIPGFKVVQCNESYSSSGVVRGLHFQWNPYMGKLIRVISGHMIDLYLDIRLNSPTFGKIENYSMESGNSPWLWVPPGFAHGNLFLEDTKIEYLCTGEYSKGCEQCICPLAADIDWSLSGNILYSLRDNLIISDKDRNGLTIEQWKNNPNSKEFTWKD